jgi:uncharacterized protein YndB with AHSA1/START domain
VYSFETIWQIPAPVERVWAELMAPSEWPRWWRGVERVQTLREGDANGVGSIRRYTFRSRLPYRLTFTLETTCVAPCTLIEGRASGELDGVGRWRLIPNAGGTDVHYDWNVATTKKWMRALAPVARPLFSWNHNVIMAWGEQGLVKRVST